MNPAPRIQRLADSGGWRGSHWCLAWSWSCGRESAAGGLPVCPLAACMWRQCMPASHSARAACASITMLEEPYHKTQTARYKSIKAAANAAASAAALQAWRAAPLLLLPSPLPLLLPLPLSLPPPLLSLLPPLLLVPAPVPLPSSAPDAVPGSGSCTPPPNTVPHCRSSQATCAGSTPSARGSRAPTEAWHAAGRACCRARWTVRGELHMCAAAQGAHMA